MGAEPAAMLCLACRGFVFCPSFLHKPRGRRQLSEYWAKQGSLSHMPGSFACQKRSEFRLHEVQCICTCHDGLGVSAPLAPRSAVAIDSLQSHRELLTAAGNALTGGRSV